jgi:hypothetical protein
MAEQTGYGERDQEPTTGQTGGDPADLPPGGAERGTGDNPDVGGIGDGPGGAGESPEGARFGADSGGRAHTSPSEGHPAGEGARSDREVGGPTAPPDAEAEAGTEPGAHGDIQTKGFDSHS